MIEYSCYGNHNGYPADKDSVYTYMYFRLTNFTQEPYRNFFSALQCISNQLSIQIKALVKHGRFSRGIYLGVVLGVATCLVGISSWSRLEFC